MQYFLDDFGNFEKNVKIWTRSTPNYYQNGSTNTRKVHGSILEKYCLCQSGIHKFLKMFENVCPRYHIVYVLFIFRRFVFRLFRERLRIYLKICFVEMRNRKMIHFSLINKRKAWIWISYLPKAWNAFLVFFLFSRKGR